MYETVILKILEVLMLIGLIPLASFAILFLKRFKDIEQKIKGSPLELVGKTAILDAKFKVVVVTAVSIAILVNYLELPEHIGQIIEDLCHLSIVLTMTLVFRNLIKLLDKQSEISE